jgi:N utilization substance protein B
VAGPRHQARQVAISVLFEVEARPSEWEAALAYATEAQELAAPAVAFATELVSGVLAHLEEIDSLLQAASTRWRLEQMGALERAVLRLAAEELAWRRQDPVAVVIDEAVELAKEMAGPEAGAFVNGVLGRVARERAVSHKEAANADS